MAAAIAVVEELLKGKWEVAGRRKGKSQPGRRVSVEVELQNAFAVLQEPSDLCAFVRDLGIHFAKECEGALEEERSAKPHKGVPKRKVEDFDAVLKEFGSAQGGGGAHEVEERTRRRRGTRLNLRCYKGGGGAHEDEEGKEADDAVDVGGAMEDTQVVEAHKVEVKAPAVQVKAGTQYGLKRFFKVQKGQSVEDELLVLVRAGFRPDQVTSKAVPVAPDAIVEAAAADKAQCLQVVLRRESARIAARGHDGGKAGVLGGRPRHAAVEDLRGIANGVDRSNRLYPGQDRRRHDVDAVEALRICEFLQQQVPRYSSEDDYWRAMVLRFRPRSKVQLQSLLSRKHVFEARVRLLKLGGRRGASGRMQGSKENLYERKDTVGVRAAGGGRKGDFKEQKDQLKVWVETERAHGHALNMSDLWTQFKFLMEEEEQRQVHFAATAEDEEARAKAELRRLEVRTRIQKIQSSKEYLKSFKKALMVHCGCSLLKPQRLVRLSLKEEQVRCELTWQMLDEAIWLVAFGGPSELKDLVLDYRSFDTHRRDCVLGFSDQVPWRGKIGGGKQLYLKAERQRQVKAPDCKDEVMQNEGMNQTRGQESENAEKFRVTVEMRQVIYNFFKDEKLVGTMGPTLLVVGGTHCRLSNISAEGTWIKGERFYYEGKEVVRHAGHKVPGAIMKSWREVRAKAPHLFEGIEVMQQPAAVVDTVINQWALEDLGSRYPVSIWQRDMLAATRSSQAKATMQVINQIEANIMGKMTPVLQLTDTDFARQLKAISEEVKDEVRQELKLKAMQAKVPASYKCFAYEVLKILKLSLDRLEAKMEKDQSVLKAARRNGMLSYRPDFEQMQLVRSDSQSWAADMPEGSHRFRSSWLDSRYAWLDTSGRPLSPDFERMEVAKSLADMEEVEYCNVEGARIGGEFYEEVALDLGEVEVDAEEKMILQDMVYKQTHPSLRALFRDLDPLLSDQRPCKMAKTKKTAEGKKRLKDACEAALNKIKKKLKADSKGLSRADPLQRITPVAGKKSGARKKKGGKAKPSLKAFSLLNPHH